LANEPSDQQALLDRQRALEIELLQARQSHRGLKRKHAAAAAASPPPADDSGGEAWMMTYLDMMTLLLVVTMAMLALAGKNHEQARKAEHVAHPLPDAQQLTRLNPPGSLLLVPQVNTPLPAAPEAPAEVVAAVAPQPPVEPQAPVETTPPKPSVDDLLKELPLDQLGDDIEVVSNESSVSFRINSEILFPSGQTDLNLGGLKVLQHLVPVLESVPHKIIVAGHTDDQDIRSSRFPSNWELSGARAGSVVRYLQSNGIKSGRLAAVGYADTRPLADNDTAQGRAKNRRVELILER
jgi:chemotaxis protein MotB